MQPNAPSAKPQPVAARPAKSEISADELKALQQSNRAALDRIRAANAGKPPHLQMPWCNYYERQKDLERGILNPPHETADQRHARMNRSNSIWEKIPKQTDEKGRPTEKLNHEAALQAARAGRIVKISYRSSGTGKDRHGHIAEVDGSKDLFYSAKWRTRVPYIDGYCAASGRAANQPLSMQFSPDKEARMDYFIYKAPRK